nr:hypothetical protein [Tanacetum cinerariifolium]
EDGNPARVNAKQALGRYIVGVATTFQLSQIHIKKGCNVLSEKLLDLESTKDLHPLLHDNPLSGSTTYPLLEEFADELPPEYDDNLQFDIESDLNEIEFLLYQDKDSSLKDSIDQKNRANMADIFVDSIPEMFTDEHTLDYSSPLIFDVYDDDFMEVEVDALPSTNNEDKIFNPGILIQEKPVEIITRVDQDKKLAISNASLMLEDFDPPFCEPLFFKEVLNSKMLLPFSSENEEKVFKPWIHTSEKVHSTPENLKTLAKEFCTQVFISSASYWESSSLGERSGEDFYCSGFIERQVLYRVIIAFGRARSSNRKETVSLKEKSRRVRKDEHRDGAPLRSIVVDGWTRRNADIKDDVSVK